MSNEANTTKDGAERQISELIEFLRFPLAVLVVAIHWNYTVWRGGYLPEFKACTAGVVPIVRSLLRVLMDCAVPAFFAVSGYLFFLAKEGQPPFSWALYGRKLKRRVHTLLIPYLLWILIELFAYSSISPDVVWVHGWHVFWAVNGGVRPLLVPLWFLRDLMVVILLAPVFYYLLRPARCAAMAWGRAVLFFAASVWIWANRWWPFEVGASFGAVFWFGAGAVLALHHKGGVVLRTPWVSSVLFGCGMVFVFLLQTRPAPLGGSEVWQRIAVQAARVLLVFSVFSLAGLVVRYSRWRFPRDFAAASMFIYCWHNVVRLGPEYVLYKIMSKTGAFAWCHADSCTALLYTLAPPVFEALAGVYVYKLLRRRLPRLGALLSGGK